MNDADIIYDGFSFYDNGIVVTSIDHLTLAARRNQLETRANRNGAVLVQSLLGTKQIVVEGYYVGATKIDTELMYDVLAAALNRIERLLIVPHAGGERRYTATPENIIIKQPDGLNRITFNIEFVVPEGNAYEQVVTTLVDADITAASTTLPLTVVGSVLARPLTVLTYGTITGGTAKTMSLRNARDFIGVTFTRDFVTGDVITIDSDNFQIYINDELVEPNGRFPTWSPGTGALFYSDTMTTRSVNILSTYKRKDL